MSETNTGTAAVSLKDYIIDLDSANQKPSVAYEVVLENNTDFILRRQTQKVQKELVILISQGLYYIRDCKNGAIDPVTIGNLRSFLRDLKDIRREHLSSRNHQPVLAGGRCHYTVRIAPRCRESCPPARHSL